MSTPVQLNRGESSVCFFFCSIQTYSLKKCAATSQEILEVAVCGTDYCFPFGNTLCLESQPQFNKLGLVHFLFTAVDLKLSLASKFLVALESYSS